MNVIEMEEAQNISEPVGGEMDRSFYEWKRRFQTHRFEGLMSPIPKLTIPPVLRMKPG